MKIFSLPTLYLEKVIVKREKQAKLYFKQARKSSEDTQVAGYAQLEKVWAR